MRVAQQVFVAATALALALPAAAAAQQPAQLAAGRWTGTVTTPGGETVAVSYTITAKNDTTAISIDAAQHGVFEASGVKLEPGKVTFTFTPGPTVTCVLTRKDDGSFAGECNDDGGGAPAQMTMVPPKKDTGSGS